MWWAMSPTSPAGSPIKQTLFQNQLLAADLGAGAVAVEAAVAPVPAPVPVVPVPVPVEEDNEW